ncbi:expressed unknown protein [Seminavis robusta]|uniref:Uncharacterized protein n=1 Tax=Seminavis robusta TaxID=568900 RepID=A0A9N8D9Z9_9STRA|nr:expressed unknown protein [Seminavis robusta]|eukprot:Sro46_g027560.1 n/a (241) ;mRNA; f:135775-136567
MMINPDDSTDQDDTPAIIPVASATPITHQASTATNTPVVSVRVVLDEIESAPIFLEENERGRDPPARSAPEEEEKQEEKQDEEAGNNGNNEAGGSVLPVPDSPGRGIWTPTFIHFKTDAVNDNNTNNNYNTNNSTDNTNNINTNTAGRRCLCAIIVISLAAVAITGILCGTGACTASASTDAPNVPMSMSHQPTTDQPFLHPKEQLLSLQQQTQQPSSPLPIQLQIHPRQHHQRQLSSLA